MTRVTVVGRGRVGRGLSRFLRESEDIEVRLVSGKTRSLAGADVVILAVPDAAIAEVSARLAPLAGNAVFLHCAGRLGVEAYGDLKRPGLGAMHPLISFADPKSPPPKASYAYAISGDARAKKAARRLVRAMGGRPLGAVHGDAYHAAAAMMANGSAALADVAIGILESLGVPRRDAARALGALLESVAANVQSMGTPKALTGPVVRGDVEAVAAHRSALKKAPRAAYDLAARLTLLTAKRAGLSAKKARRMLNLLS